MHLLIGASGDVTADLIVDSLGDSVLRVNNDRPHDHDFVISAEGFEIADAYGRRVDQDNLRTVILRKSTPVEQGRGGEELYACREHTKAIEGLLDWLERMMPRAMPMSHRAMNKATKFICSAAARNYFAVPQWIFTSVPARASIRRPVVKNLCGLPIEEASPSSSGAMLYVQEVQLHDLAEHWPWFLQEKVESRYDLTVLYLGGECHALRLDRLKFEGLDWRKFIGAGVDEQWEPVRLPPSICERIKAYMVDMNLSYGRLDFLYSQEDFGDIQFLEVNPHGQWAWMDLKRDRGIFDAMMRFLTTPRTPSDNG